MSDKEEKEEAFRLIETLAAAGARLTALAGGGEVECGRVQFASKEGMFSEEIAHQRIKSLLAENARLQARIDAAVKLTDTGSEDFQYVAAWRVVDKIREVLQP